MNDILSSIMTLNDRDELLDFLDEIERAMHNMSVDLEQFLMQKAPHNLGQATGSYLGDSLFSRDTEVVRQKIKNLKKEMNLIPTVTITIAVAYDRNSLSDLFGKIRSLIGQQALIDIKVDPTIIGGAIVEGNGRLTKSTVKQYFDAKGGEYGF